MPNFVYAAFNVTGPSPDIEHFCCKMFKTISENGVDCHDALGGPKIILDYAEVLPMPPEWEDGIEAWGVEAWGTKWCGFDVEHRMTEDGGLWFQFTSAWSFPEDAFKAIAAEFPSLVFDGSAYEESHEFEFVGEFNGANDWGPGEIEWIEI